MRAVYLIEIACPPLKSMKVLFVIDPWRKMLNRMKLSCGLTL